MMRRRNKPKKENYSQISFIDDSSIKSAKGVTRGIETVEKLGPVLFRTNDWEGEKTSLFGSVIWDEDRKCYRIYYLQDIPGSPIKTALWTAYAESKDGKIWKKPFLSQLKINRQKTNILVPSGLKKGVVGIVDSVFRNPLTNKWEMFLWALGNGYVRNVKALSHDGIEWQICNWDKPCLYR